MWLRIAIGAAAAVFVVLIGAFVALSTVDWSKHADLAIAEVKEATGRDLEIAGKIDVGLLPPRLIVDGVSFSNAPWGTRPGMAKAKRVEVRAALLPLLVGDVRLKIDIVEPDVFLETDAKGRGNWVIERTGKKGARRAAPSESKGTPVDLSAVRFTNGVVQYRSGRTGKTRRLTFDEAYIRPAGLRGREILVKAKVDGLPVSLAAITDKPVIETLGGGDMLGVELQAKIADATVTAVGRVGFPVTGAYLALKVRAEIPESDALAKLAGERVPRLPPLKLEGEVKSERRVHAFERVKLAMGKSTLSGSGKADLSGARFKISADVAAPVIDLRELQAPAAKGRADTARATGRIFSNERLPLSLLNAFDAEVNLKVDRLVMPPALLFEAVRGRIALNRGKLETRSVAMRMGGGDVTLAGTLDASDAKRAQFGMNVAGSKIELGKMMAELGQGDIITGGETELKADLRSTGASPAALASALDGQVRIVMGPARTRNRMLDRADVVTQVLNAVNPSRKTDPYTQVQCAVINVPVHGGVITVDRTVAMETSHVGIAMAGTVNLTSETLDLSIRPQAKEGIGVGVGSLANLVKVQGTLANPEVGVDVAGAAGAAAQIGIGVITGGLSLLAKGLFDKATMEAPCKTALGRGGGTASGTSGDQGAEQPATGGVGGFFERLFK
jgi:hypothetical protein